MPYYMYVDVCLKHRLKQSNAPLEKKKAVVCNQLKDFWVIFFLLKSNSVIAYPMVHHVARTNQSAAFVHVS